MARAGPIRNRSTRSKPYERGQRINTEKQQGWSIFGVIRDFFLGSSSQPENNDSDEDMDDAYSQSMGRVPAIIDEEPSQFARPDHSVSRFQSSNNSLAMTPRRPGQNLQPPIMSTPFRDPHMAMPAASSAESSVISQQGTPLNTASPNEALLQFFKEKGDQKLSNMEVVGVLSLIGQAVSRNESMIDFSTIHGADGSNASYDMPSNILSGAHTSTPNVSVPDQYSFRSSPSTSRVWSRSRRGLSSGPKISRSKPVTPYSKPALTSQVESPPSMSNTATALLEILDEPNASSSGPLSPRKRKDTIEDSYTKYRPSRSSGLRNSILASNPEVTTPSAELDILEAAPKSVPGLFKPLEMNPDPRAPQPQAKSKPDPKLFLESGEKPQFKSDDFAFKPVFTSQPPQPVAEPVTEPKANPQVHFTASKDEVIDLVDEHEEIPVPESISKPPVTLAKSAVSTDTIPDFVFDPIPEEGEPMDFTPAEQEQVRELETSFTF